MLPIDKKPSFFSLCSRDMAGATPPKIKQYCQLTVDSIAEKPGWYPNENFYCNFLIKKTKQTVPHKSALFF